MSNITATVAYLNSELGVQLTVQAQSEYSLSPILSFPSPLFFFFLMLKALVVNTKNVAYQLDFCWDLFTNCVIKRMYYQSKIFRKNYVGAMALLQWTREHTAHRIPVGVVVEDFTTR
jgi:hypothetical protein